MSGPCFRCHAALGASCCETPYGEKLATLTRSDVRRIEAATGRPGGSFTEEEPLTLDEAQAYVTRRPQYEGYFSGSPLRLTLRRRGNACALFTPDQGCSLSAEDRPTACRLYPFEPQADGSIRLLVDRFDSVEAARASGEHACLAVQEASGWHALKQALGTSDAELTQLAERLRGEVRAHRPDVGWTTERARRRSRKG